VFRAFVRRYGHARIERAITVGTPHHGSTHAKYFIGRSVSKLRPGNAWLDALNASEGTPPAYPLISLWSWHDNMVAPQTSCILAGACNVEVIGVGHNALLGDSDVHARIAQWLRGA
jgi:triacylglycerol esterase/lipase EstA (alpha/beta hydrolase family)